MTREEIKGTYSEERIMNICSKVSETGNFLGFAKNYLYDADKQIVRNVLCGISKASDEEVDQLKPIMDEMIDLAMKTDIPSIRRPLLGIIERMEMSEDEIRTDFLDFCLDRMADPEEVPSIQSLSLKVAYKMCKPYPELMEELKRILEGMEMSYYTAALKCVRRKILSGKATVRRAKGMKHRTTIENDGHM